jgi:hypothetical protein
VTAPKAAEPEPAAPEYDEPVQEEEGGAYAEGTLPVNVASLRSILYIFLSTFSSLAR